ncbi:MAG: response regulator [Blastocatellales bacterium]|nr:response regulator [Blastocatellales bacterium]
MLAQNLLIAQNLVLKMIASGVRLESVLEAIVRQIEERAEGSIASVLLLDEDGVTLRHGAAPNLPEAYCLAIDGAKIGPSVGSCGTAAYRREEVVVTDIAADPLWADYAALALAHGLRSCWSTPIVSSSGRLLGTFALYHRTPYAPSAEERHLVAMFTDLASVAIERREAESALRQSQERLESLVHSVEGIVWEASADTFQFTFVSQQAERILGYPVERWVSDPTFWADHIHPDDRDEAVRYCQEATADRRNHEFEYRMVAANGDERWFKDYVAIIEEPDGSAKLRGIIVDITKLKQAEQSRRQAEEALRESAEQLRQAQKMDAVGRLAGGIAHDFNNLLTAINGYSELAMNRLPAGDPLRSDLQEIRKAGQRAADLTQQLLAFSRKQMMQPRVIALNTVVADMERMLRRLIGEDIELSTHLASDLRPIKADPSQIAQAIVNLALNARDAMPDGGRLTIATANVEFSDESASRQAHVSPGRYVMLSISDTGTGMDEATRERIFEPFFTTKEVGKGTGLGLSMVYGIVAQSGGRIEVESAPDRGTTLRIYLPQAVEESTSAKSKAAAEEAPPQGAETILLVEDEELVRQLTQQILQMHGYNVLAAADGIEAIAICESRAEPIDLLLTDVVLPQMNGRALADRLLEMRPGMKTLFMSGYAESSIVRHGVLGPGTEFIHKPFQPHALARKVRGVLDAKNGLNAGHAK